MTSHGVTNSKGVPASGDGGLGVVLGVLGVVVVLGVEDVVATAEALAEELLVTAELVAEPALAEELAELEEPEQQALEAQCCAALNI